MNGFDESFVLRASGTIVRCCIELGLSHPKPALLPDVPRIFAFAIEMLLLLAAASATEQELKILRDSVSLSAEQIADAHAIGMKEPDRVRLLCVETVLRSTQPQLRATCDAINFFTLATLGLTLGYGTFIGLDRWGDRLLVVHEFADVSQCERLGGILPFLRRYLFECLTIGYAAAPLELEANALTARVCVE